MRERTLLFLSLCTAIIGILVLAMLPEREPETITGVVAWNNQTSLLLYEQEEVWTDTGSSTDLSGMCIRIQGYPDGIGMQDARIVGVADRDATDCQD